VSDKGKDGGVREIILASKHRFVLEKKPLRRLVIRDEDDTPRTRNSIQRH